MSTEVPLPGVVGGQQPNNNNNQQQQPSATAGLNNNVTISNQQEAASLVSGGKVSHSTHAKGKRGKGGKGKGKGKGKGGKSGGGKGKASGGGKRGGKKAPVSRSTLADLTFPVGRIHSRMKLNLLKKQRCGSTAAIYLTALLEYLTAELLDLSTHACELAGNKRITPRHILLAIKSDKELDQLITATISKGGVQPGGVNRMLLNKGSKAAQQLAGGMIGKKKSSSKKKSSGGGDSKKSKKSSSSQSQKPSSQTTVPQRGKKSAA